MLPSKRVVLLVIGVVALLGSYQRTELARCHQTELIFGDAFFTELLKRLTVESLVLCDLVLLVLDFC